MSELVAIKLLKDWNEHKTGATVVVDPVRAASMIERKEATLAEADKPARAKTKPATTEEN